MQHCLLCILTFIHRPNSWARECRGADLRELSQMPLRSFHNLHFIELLHGRNPRSWRLWDQGQKTFRLGLAGDFIRVRLGRKVIINFIGIDHRCQWLPIFRDCCIELVILQCSCTFLRIGRVILNPEGQGCRQPSYWCIITHTSPSNAIFLAVLLPNSTYAMMLQVRKES